MDKVIGLEQDVLTMKNREQFEKTLSRINYTNILSKSSVPKDDSLGEIKYIGCAVCHSGRKLNVHHLNYKENITMLLCRDCHLRVHFGKGLEHLNPVGKKLKIMSSARYERLKQIIPDRHTEYGRYQRLLNVIFRDYHEKPREIISKHQNMPKAVCLSNIPKSVSIFAISWCGARQGSGGVGVILEHEGYMKEIAEGYRNTTNNRLDLISILMGLEALNQRCEVKLLTNSLELVKIMSERSWEKWQATKLNTPYELDTRNADLWEKLLKLYEIHSVKFKLIESDIEKYYEKRCEKLAIKAFYKSK